MRFEPDSNVSPTDQMPSVYHEDNVPFGYDICGRRVLHRDGRPGFPKKVAEFERKLFFKAMLNYRKRTGLKPSVEVWSFPAEDFEAIKSEINELNKLQGIMEM